MNGFLKEVCRKKGDGGKIYFKCATSESYYTVIRRTVRGSPMLSDGCPGDDHYYQVCGLVKTDRTEIGNTDLLCGGFTCMQYMDLGSRNNATMVELLSEMNESMFCSTGGYLNSCHNTLMEEKLCATVGEERTRMLSGNYVDKSLLCNDKCDDTNSFCEDEADCNGFQYGLYCETTYPFSRLIYLPVDDLCKGYNACKNGEDNNNCSTTNPSKHSCFSYNYGTGKPVRVPLTNRTRCNVYEPGFNQLGSNHTYCQNFMDQTNCTDWSRVGVTCKINNFTSTVSKYMVCAMQSPLCDDGLENICLRVSLSCNVHKHRLCDGTTDCADKSDERIHLCSDMTEGTCIRTASTDAKPRRIPLVWLNDGILDCMDEKDEQKIWAVCGVDLTERFVVENKANTCENVFLCPNTGFVQYKDLCDGFESCGMENSVCKVSQRYPDIQTTVTSSISISESSISLRLSYCLKGIEDILRLQNGQCQSAPYRFPEDKVFGVPEKNRVHLPSAPQNCDYLYGENYVWTSCIGNCVASSCPLKTIPKYDSCPHQFSNRIGTLVGNGYLTFLIKFKGVYHNNYYICAEDNSCLEYSKVCDLVEDCSDGSDETGCTNHFKCEITNRYIPITQKCDGTIDCLDTSDECNERCSKRLLTSKKLRVGSWFMGISALVGNTMVMVSELRRLTQCETIASLTNKSFIILIAVGDLMVGSYLVWIAIVDAFVYGADYCNQQWSWLTSSNCSILGVLSTTGTLISLFSMCTLSVSRAYRIRAGLRMSEEATKSAVVKLLLLIMIVITLSCTLALLPLLPYFEDFFVNGMHYDPQMKLFIRFVDKEQHFNILQQYYGRMKKATMNWKLINEMVSAMFSHDLNYTDFVNSKKTLNFYGNDAVCLFKYFVRPSDPQKSYVWCILFTNILCFAIIAICYSYINLKYLDSASAVGSPEGSQKNTQRKIAIIISTDFVCWVPFVFFCVMHSFEVVDGTQWYSFFSMGVLPINSVINPLLYSDAVPQMMQKLTSVISNLQSSFTTSRVVPESIEMRQIRVHASNQQP